MMTRVELALERLEQKLKAIIVLLESLLEVLKNK